MHRIHRATALLAMLLTALLVAASFHAAAAYCISHWAPTFLLRVHGMSLTEVGLSLGLVTGTNGKTSTTYLVESILARAGHRVGLIGTVEIRHPGGRERAVNTTPESLDLQRLLRSMLTLGVESAVMEVSSHALALHRIDGTLWKLVRVFDDPATAEVMLTTVDGVEPLPGARPLGYRMGIWVVEVEGFTTYRHSGFWGTLATWVPELDLTLAACSAAKPAPDAFSAPRFQP